MYTNKVKKIIFFRIPLSICNFRCHYCYLAQRDEHYQGIQPVMKYSPEQVALACSPKRLGGLAYFNFCADGETMLLKDLDLYVKELVKQGHFVEIITNMTITNMVDKFMEWPREMLEHVEFKCSFHYLELKKKKLLEVFAKNANQLWGKGASINIEVTPSDELIPYIEELKNFSYSNFGALPHITIARNDSRPIIITSAVLNIVMSIALVNKLGINGVLIGTFITSLIYLFSRFYIIARYVYKIKYNYYVKKVLYYAIISCFTFIVSYLVSENIKEGEIIWFIIKTILVVLLALFLTSLFLSFSREFEFLKNKLLPANVRKFVNKYTIGIGSVLVMGISISLSILCI